MKKRKGFTLIEVIIVIVIIGILIGTGMSLNRGSLEKLRAKSAAEEVSSFFDTTFLQLQASNYQDGKAYTGIEITLEKDKVEIPYVYQLRDAEAGTLSGSFGGEFSITAITGDEDKVLDSVSIQYVPFSPDCKFKDNDDVHSIYFSAKPRGLKNACFQLDKNYCKLRVISCEEDRDLY